MMNSYESFSVGSASSVSPEPPQAPPGYVDKHQHHNNNNNNDNNGTNQFRRTYKACLNCRLRKVKCDFGDLANPSKPPCARCKREGRDCQLVASKRGGIKNVLAGKERKAAALAAAMNEDAIENGLVSAADDSISRRELHNTSDALEILAHAARSFPRIPNVGSTTTSGASTPLFGRFPPTCNGTGMRAMTGVSPDSKVKLVDSDLVAKQKIVTAEEATVLVNYFFEALHPFYPFIPESLHSADNIADMPILLAAITTLASRYYVPEIAAHEDKKVIEDECYAIHKKLWDYCQKLISETVWAEASTRSIGTVFSFLLFSEWNPRAIHQRWHDYANPEGQEGPECTNPNEASHAGLGAARRSDRMSWMLIGSGIRLAQDLGLMDTDPKVYLATHLSEIVLALRMGRRSMLAQFLNEPTPNLEFTPVNRPSWSCCKSCRWLMKRSIHREIPPASCSKMASISTFWGFSRRIWRIGS
jgi:hypothetical protein